MLNPSSHSDSKLLEANALDYNSSELGALPPFNCALKEWAIAIEALLEGQTVLLMRKGGIREEKGRFEVQHRRVWLYPTYEHQRREWLKEPYARQIEPVDSGWHPQTVDIQGWADVTHIFCVSEAIALDRLMPLHIWTESFATERFKWKPRSPLYLLLLRAYRLRESVTIPYRDSYGGCRSWIQFEQALDPNLAMPVLSQEDYQHQVDRVTAAIAQTASLTD